ncbi:hypothetical protein BROUX41_003218 [Berkeleyomyces rouxiae]|uniref:uncharacterized protein n=1 Tax=Berkeleyomyces rouxiae TaxID=2035830 RepID=UPI003B76B237
MFQNSFFQQSAGGQFQSPVNANANANANADNPSQHNGLNLDANGFDFMTGFDALSPTAMAMGGLASNMEMSMPPAANDQNPPPAAHGVSNLIARFESTACNGLPRKRKPTSPRESQQPPPHPPQPSTHVMVQGHQQHQPLQQMAQQQRHMSQSGQSLNLAVANSPASVSAQQPASYFQNHQALGASAAAAAEMAVMGTMKHQQFGLPQKSRQPETHSFPVNASPAANIMIPSPISNPPTNPEFASMLGSVNGAFSPIISSPQAQLRSPIANDPFAALNPVRMTSPPDQMSSYAMPFNQTPITPTNVNVGVFGDMKTPAQDHASIGAMTSSFANPQTSSSAFHDPFGQDLISFVSIDGPGMDALAGNTFGSIDNTAFMNTNPRIRTDSLPYQMNVMPTAATTNFFMPQQQNSSNNLTPSHASPSISQPQPQPRQHTRFPGSMPTPDSSSHSTPGFNIWKPPNQKTPKAPPLPARPSTAVAPQPMTAQKTAGGDTIMGQPIAVLQQQIQQQQRQQQQQQQHQQRQPEEIPPKKPPRPKPVSMGNSSVNLMSTQVEGSSAHTNLKFSPHDAAKVKPAPPPRPTASKPTREQVPAESWENHKAVIRQLYLDERRPLKEVMQLMVERHGFRATPKMYKTRFSQWGFAKNNTEEEVKRLLSIKFQRDAEGKTSEFVRNGRVVNIRTYLKRKGKTEYDLYDFEANANLPGHTRCRTPPPLPNLPGHMAADVKRVQEVITGNMHKALLMCKEAQADTVVPWSTTMLWGAISSDIMWNANYNIKHGHPERGVSVLNDAFRYLDDELKSMTPQVIKELLLGLVNRDPAVVTALCKFFSAWTAKHLERSHPLRPIFTALYSIQQEHGTQTLSDLIWTTMPSFVDDLEAIYGRKHPYVAHSLLDLLELAEQQYLLVQHQEPDQTLEEYRSRVTQLIAELQPLLGNIESAEGIQSTDATALRYMLLQMQHAIAPDAPITLFATSTLHRHMREDGRLFPCQFAAAGLFCYHDPIKVTPNVRRCRYRYETVAKLLERHENIHVKFYFEEDMHDTDHSIPGTGLSQNSFTGGAGGSGSGHGSNQGFHNPQAALASAFELQGGFGGGFAWS